MIYLNFKLDIDINEKNLTDEPFDSDKPQKNKHLRYTFVTGKETSDIRKTNLENFNSDDNKYGEYIQIMILYIHL